MSSQPYAPSAPPLRGDAPPPPYVPEQPVDDAAARAFCAEHGWPSGLAALAADSRRSFARRFWIVDNSGSMSMPDGHRLVSAGSAERMVACSRWDEVCDMISFHAALAAALGAPTEFRLLNPPRGGQQTVSVRSRDDLPAVDAALASGPAGGTPICQHVSHVAALIASEAATLRANGQQAVLTIVTDGLPSDGDLAAAMQPLARLPVWIVVRLCTDEDEVIEFWNNLDKALECDIEVLDDLAGEAAECQTLNPWLTYGLPLHRLREWGVHHKLIDLLDERALAPVEVRDFLALLLGGPPLPHPEVDAPGLVKEALARQRDSEQPYNALRKRRTPWVDGSRLLRAVDRRGCAIQ